MREVHLALWLVAVVYSNRAGLFTFSLVAADPPFRRSAASEKWCPTRRKSSLSSAYWLGVGALTYWQQVNILALGLQLFRIGLVIIVLVVVAG